MELIQWVFESGFTYSSGSAETIHACLFLDLVLRFSVNIFDDVTNVLVSYIFSLKRHLLCLSSVAPERACLGKSLLGSEGTEELCPVLYGGCHLGG